jgi:hypothetical protein
LTTTEPVYTATVLIYEASMPKAPATLSENDVVPPEA